MLIGCRRRHRLIIAEAEAAILTVNVTHRLVCLSVASHSLLHSSSESEPYCHSGMFVCLSVAGRASSRCCCCFSSTSRASGWCYCCVAAVMSRRDSGLCQTLLVLQFVIEFASIWAQYSIDIRIDSHRLFLICALISKWQPCERDASCLSVCWFARSAEL